MTLQDPDEVVMASKLTLPWLGGGPKTSRGVLQPHQPSVNCHQPQVLIKASDKLGVEGWGEHARHLPPELEALT